MPSSTWLFMAEVDCRSGWLLSYVVDLARLNYVVCVIDPIPPLTNESGGAQPPVRSILLNYPEIREEM